MLRFKFFILLFICVYSVTAQDTIQLTDLLKNDLKSNYLRKINALSNYFNIISDKTKNDTLRNKSIDLAVMLFMSENNLVEVSSLYTKEPKRFKVRAYLNKLKMLPYTKTTIEWFDIFFASKFTKRPDGKYEGIAQFHIRVDTTGTNIEGGKYKDITKKNIQIIIEERTIETGDQRELVWEVFLGDIKVEETKSASNQK